MAFTITAVPATYSSVHDDLVYTVAFPEHTSDPVTYPNYKFIGDIYIGGNLIARIKKIQDPVTGIGIFNVSQIVRNYLTTTFNPTANVIVAQELGDLVFRVGVTMHFGEEYNFTSFLDQVVDSERTYFNNYNGRLKGATSSISLLLNNIASNRPRTAEVLRTTAYSFLPFFATSGMAPVFEVTVHGGGVTYSTVLAPTALDMMVLNVSPVAINAVAPGTITAATDYYTVNINGQLIRYDIICEAQYTTSMVHFLNQYGGFESKLFSKVSRKTFDITKKDFGKLAYTVDGSGVVTYKNANGVYNESRSIYSSQYKEKLSLNSDLLTDGEYTWLADLLISPMVYIEDGGYLFPCIITDTSYEPKKFVNDDLTNLTLNIEYGTQLSAQYR